MTEAKPIVPWKSKPQGFAPYLVQAFELPERGLRVYLRWRHRGNWKKCMVRDEHNIGLLLRTSKGTLIEARTELAIAAAKALYDVLADTAGAGATPQLTDVPLTFAEGRALAFDAKSGRYPTSTALRREIAHALQFAEVTWGELGLRTWEALKKRHLRILWRARIEQLLKQGDHGYTATETTVKRVLTVAAWLRAEEYLPSNAAVFPPKWRDELKRDWMELTKSDAEPTPKRPRHTLEEMRRIMAVTRQVDPRFELVMALGAEQRLGQVVRARRSALDLTHATFKIPGRGKKRGAVLELTDGQMAVVRRALSTGYLSRIETMAADYPLFPGLQLEHGRKGLDPKAVERHVNASPVNAKRTLRGWFDRAEQLAGVPHIKGRGAYGLRRQAVDAALAEDISAGALQQAGGWTNSKVPQEIYREQERVADRREARDVRAKIRGEVSE